MRYLLILMLGIITTASAAQAADPLEQTLTIKNHAFNPAELAVPTGQKIKLTVKNEDDTVAEFESSDLNREKIVSAHSEITVYVGPLDAGSYGFFDDFRRDTTRGTIVAK